MLYHISTLSAPHRYGIKVQHTAKQYNKGNTPACVISIRGHEQRWSSRCCAAASGLVNERFAWCSLCIISGDNICISVVKRNTHAQIHRSEFEKGLHPVAKSCVIVQCTTYTGPSVLSPGRSMVVSNPGGVTPHGSRRQISVTTA